MKLGRLRHWCALEGDCQFTFLVAGNVKSIKDGDLSYFQMPHCILTPTFNLGLALAL